MNKRQRTAELKVRRAFLESLDIRDESLKKDVRFIDPPEKIPGANVIAIVNSQHPGAVFGVCKDARYKELIGVIYNTELGSWRVKTFGIRKGGMQFTCYKSAVNFILKQYQSRGESEKTVGGIIKQVKRAVERLEK
jgi:hypothetical protein